MKIAVATRFVGRAGGVETYLEAVLPSLASRGHDVSVWHEFPALAQGDRIVPAGIPSHYLGTGADGVSRAVAMLDASRPGLIFLHGLSSPAIEAMLASVAPLVVLLHAYDGTCVSGTKTHSFPASHVCSRPLGPGCLLRYYPRRCGGLSPLTMFTSYSRQRQRQVLLRASAFVATLSEHMRLECVAQGVDAGRVVHLPAFVPQEIEDHVLQNELRCDPSAPGRRLHLLFIGRMEKLKGGHVFLDALDRLDPDLRRRLRVTFAGDGRERVEWEQQAARVSRGELDVHFVGWLSPRERAELFRAVDLLVVPSIWPEPLGLVGLEAAAAAVPAVAFDAGGIREWLSDGVNGRLMPAGRTPAASLAKTLQDCLEKPELLARWGTAAFARARRLTLSKHIDALELLFGRAAAPTPVEAGATHV